jgi:hypothetical protein
MSAPLPIPVGTVATDPPFKNDLGRLYVSGGNLYKLVKAASSIAAASQGLQLATALSSGVPTYAVSLNTVAVNPLGCGAIPSTLTGAIAASGYFLALVEGSDALAQTGTAASAITTGSILVTGTASDLVRATTAVALPSDFDQHGRLACGVALQLNTGSTILPYQTNYRSVIR